ncbi:beta-1,6-galactosyltransferase GALT29A-like [Gastrolobium bilobum]|uniref:beta-1,6-galactosyltransferase GALT29A-like n=1 Tax=Gastrolobium bilobum TaxID=150636 RepID=UPI002AB2A96C|nr:beta-1,6-galactosyltransferase GALT29A-like [Gastrolobium bilobum]
MKCSFRPLFGFLLLVVFVAAVTELQSIVLFQLQPPTPETLLKYAAIDTVEEQWKHEIQQLLDSNLGNQARVPVTLRSPLFQRYLPDFQRALRDWALKKSFQFQPNIMSELTRLVKYPIELVGSYERYSSCAVVGNSGILLNKDYGKMIDSHEVVIRLNNARVEGFENKVGSKTNISFVNSNILHACARIVGKGCLCHSYGADVATVMYICQPAHFMDYIVCNSSLKAPLLVTDPRFDVLCARIVKYYSLKLFFEETGKVLEQWGPAHDEVYFHYSSGFQAVMLALGICENVSMLGFGKSASAKHHYHTNQRAELGLHDYEAEYAFYRDLLEGHKPIPFISDNIKIPPLVMYQ